MRFVETVDFDGTYEMDYPESDWYHDNLILCTCTKCLDVFPLDHSRLTWDEKEDKVLLVDVDPIAATPLACPKCGSYYLMDELIRVHKVRSWSIVYMVKHPGNDFTRLIMDRFPYSSKDKALGVAIPVMDKKENTMILISSNQTGVLIEHLVKRGDVHEAMVVPTSMARDMIETAAGAE